MLVVFVNRPPSVPLNWTAWETILVSTVSRSRVELTAWPTSPSALSSPTERVNSLVRSSSSLNKPDVLDGDARPGRQTSPLIDLAIGKCPDDRCQQLVRPIAVPSLGMRVRDQ